MVSTQQDLTGRQKIGEEETSVGRCQGGQSELESPRQLSSFPGGNVGSGKGAVVLSQGYCHLWEYFFNVCVNVCIVHNTHFLLGYLYLEGRGLTWHFNVICPTLALSRRQINA